SIQTTIPACTRLPIDITSFDTTTNSTKGTPPYYMIALAIDGTPSTTLIGTSDTGVDYTVTYPVGTRLLLSVADSKGSPGGTYAPVTVTAGTSSSCIITPSTSPTFTVTSNVTSDLSTCEPVRLSISGGVSPYHLTLAADNAPSVTNDTLPEGNNIYTYISRASPGGQLVAAISDSTGRWASGTPIFNTKGSADTACPGLVSSSTKGTVQPPSSGSNSSVSTPPGSSSSTSDTPLPSSSSSSSTNSAPSDTPNNNTGGNDTSGEVLNSKARNIGIILGVSMSVALLVAI
ncbi:hypothetical protein CVT25_014059, partial [Psilocybe cyanescens]